MAYIYYHQTLVNSWYKYVEINNKWILSLIVLVYGKLVVI